MTAEARLKYLERRDKQEEEERDALWAREGVSLPVGTCMDLCPETERYR